MEFIDLPLLTVEWRSRIREVSAEVVEELVVDGEP